MLGRSGDRLDPVDETAKKLEYRVASWLGQEWQDQPRWRGQHDDQHLWGSRTRPPVLTWGFYAAEAAVELLIGNRSWLFREDFLEIAVEFGWEVFSDQPMAAVDFVAAAGALEAGVLPCSAVLTELTAGT